MEIQIGSEHIWAILNEEANICAIDIVAFFIFDELMLMFHCYTQYTPSEFFISTT